MTYTLERLAKQEKLFGHQVMNQFAEVSLAIIGCGRNGCSFATLAAYAGFMHFFLIDPDVAEPRNVNATVPFFKEDVGKPKVEVVKAKLKAIDPSIRVETLQSDVQGKGMECILNSSDILVDATDSIPAKKFLNARVAENLQEGNAQKLVSLGSGAFVKDGRILQLGAQATLFEKGGACLMCGTLDPSDKVNLSRVSFVVVNVMASLLGLQLLVSSLSGEDSGLERHDFVLYDILSQQVVALNRSPRERCEFCGREESNG